MFRDNSKNKLCYFMYLFLAFSLLFLPSGFANTLSLKTYLNPRFAYSISYPSNLLIPQGESANGDGQEFISKDSKASLVVFGSFNASKESLKVWYEDVTLNSVDQKFTYQVFKKNFFVVSGLENGNVIYQKTYLVKDRFISFILRYPESERSTFDPLVKKIADSFHPSLPSQ